MNFYILVRAFIYQKENHSCAVKAPLGASRALTSPNGLQHYQRLTKRRKILHGCPKKFLTLCFSVISWGSF